MSTLQSIERAARRLRSAEAQVKDLRVALEQEIGRAIETTCIPISEMARVAGPSRTAVYDASERWERTQLQARATGGSAAAG